MGDPENGDHGGSAHGAPRRWTGKGPRPARHVPWPELFKHHESVLKGHLKMMDMVRKHCVEGSGNWKMAQECVDRTHGMIRDFKSSIYNFVPPANNIDRVPLGASSASMYPGYSPADHIYGEAAQEYGQRIAEARKRGFEIKQDPEGLEYVVGQSARSAREQIEEIHREREEAKVRRSTGLPSKPTEGDSKAEPQSEEEEDLSNLFTIDSNPTPLGQFDSITTDIRPKNKANDKAKRRVSFQDEQPQNNSEAALKSKKKKTAPMSEGSQDRAEAKDEFEDAVAARLSKKEEKRRKKEDKKRKRESDSSQAAPDADAMVSIGVGVPAEASSEKPKKKKHKKELEVNAEDHVAEGVEEKKSKKREKKKRSAKEESEDLAVEDGEKHKKKRKKEAAE